MVRVALPPPDARRRINPIHHMLPAGTDLFRIYDPDAPHGPRNGRTFRWRGPYARFDHHRGTGRRERRGVWYGGLTLSSAVVEAFDIGILDPGTKHAAVVATVAAASEWVPALSPPRPSGTVRPLEPPDTPHDEWPRFIIATSHEPSDPQKRSAETASA